GTPGNSPAATTVWARCSCGIRTSIACSVGPRRPDSVTTRRIVVTGGTAGIGLAIARRLRIEGHGVFVCGRNARRLEAALEELKRETSPAPLGGTVCDVCDLPSVKRMVEVAVAELGGLDGLVNNAGIAFIREFDEITPAMWS